MDKILEYINKKTDNKYLNFNFDGAVLKKNESTMQLSFSYIKNTENTENFDDLLVLCKEYFSKLDLNIEVIIKDITPNLKSMKAMCYEIVRNVFQNQSVAENDIKLSFGQDENILTINYARDFGAFEDEYKAQIKDEFYTKFKQNLTVVFKKKKVENFDTIQNREEKILEDNLIFESKSKSQIVKLKNIKNIYGEIPDDNAALVGNYDDESNVLIVGTMRGFQVKETKPKEQAEGEPEKKFTPKKYLSFSLVYEDKEIKCNLFLTKEQEVIELKDGKVYAVSGTINNFNNMISVRVKSVAECDFVPPKIAWRDCPSKYNYVMPEKYVQTEQVGLFFVDDTTSNKYLLDNTFVVYDLETTGINLVNDKIIDIGAFKIVNGKIVEKFSTFVNPQVPIPAEASKVNRITDDMVASYPSIDKVLPDFYKFCYGSIIVGYNSIGFDDAFINREGKRLRYNFDNVRNDAFVIAKQNLPGLKNYKLATVCANQNVPLIDAHRAINDALATAKLFIKLAEKFC